MKNTALTFALTLLCLSYSRAATNQVESTPRAYQLETVIVQATRIQPLSTPMGQDELLNDLRSQNAAQAVQTVPGVAGACRSIDAPEISIRGLGWERVPTQLDFLPLYGSCPARMDPPATYLSPESIANMTIVKGLPSVTYGAGGTGGRVMVRTVANATQPAINGATANTSVTWDGGRDGYASRAGAKVGNGKVEIGASANVVDYDDYDSGSGQNVPAENRSHGAGVNIRFTPDADNGYFFSWNMHKVDHLDYPALPMDATDVTANTFTFGARHENIGSLLEDLEWQAGYSDSTHDMDNSDKPNRARMDAKANTKSKTYGARIASGWRFSQDTKWTIGVDAHHLKRDGTRTRDIKIAPPAPGTYRDPIWPDAHQTQVGLFAESSTELDNDSRLRLGLRADGIFSDIDRGGEPTPFDPTVRDGYAKYYGSSARDTDRNEALLSGNVLWEIPQGDSIEWFIGAGCVQRAASITELYYAYAPAPGGFQVGNPTLDPETKAEIDGGLDYYGDRLEIGGQVFASYIWDYILETHLETLPNGATVRGFENTDAILAGGELEGRWKLSNEWSVPFSMAYVRGRNTSDNRDLPLIPPLSGRVALRWDSAWKMRPWAEAAFRAATSQHEVDSQYPESETSAWQVVDLRAGFELPKGFGLEAGIENLFDQDYADHLARETLFPQGDLVAGEKVPMPGRFFYAGVKWAM